MKRARKAGFFLLLLSIAVQPSAFAQSTFSRAGAAGSRLQGAKTSGTNRPPAFAPDHRLPPRQPHHPHTPLLIPDSDFGGPDVSVSVQQGQPMAQPAHEKAAEKRYYVPPRWVETEHGVEVLMPGFWTDDPGLAGIRRETPRRNLPEY